MNFNMLFKALILMSLSAFSINCKPLKALDAVVGMDKKMNKTNAQIKTTNDNMESMKQEVIKTNSNMGDMLDEIKKTNQGVQLQKIGIAIEHIINPENRSEGQAMAGARIFAQTASNEQIADFFYNWITNFHRVKNKVSLQFFDKMSDEEKARHFDEIESWSRGLRALAFMIPEDKLAEIVHEQVHYNGGGLRRSAVLEMLALRAEIIGYVMNFFEFPENPDRQNTFENLEMIQEYVRLLTNFVEIATVDFIDEVSHSISRADSNAKYSRDTKGKHTWEMALGYKVKEVAASVTKDMVVLLKSGFEEQLDCSKVSSKDSVRKLERLLRDTAPLFAAYDVEPPQGVCAN